MTERRRELLERVPLFAQLEVGQLDALAKVAHTRTLPARQELFHKGDEGAQVYVTVSGRLKVATTSPEGADVTLNIMDEGEVFGDLALLAGGRRTATVTALTDCELLVLERRDFLQFLRQQPEVAINLLGVVAQRLVRISELVEDTIFLNLPARLSKKLLELGELYGEETGDGLRLTLNLSQSELGSMVGTSRESVNKQIRVWAEQGVLSMERGQITLHRIEALERFAGLVFQ
ncbi:MAG: Crp/Fnr family transcriptional regulator [Myxococcota bacterium]|nr:Crp/Fnr family transcriptional regulator [Myxococcota bacterium]